MSTFDVMTKIQELRILLLSDCVKGSYVAKIPKSIDLQQLYAPEVYANMTLKERIEVAGEGTELEIVKAENYNGTEIKLVTVGVV